MLEFYGGNESMIRTDEEIDEMLKQPEQRAGSNFRQELSKLNKHMRGNYVVLNPPKSFNPDFQ